MTRERLSELSEEELGLLLSICELDASEQEECSRKELEDLLFEAMQEGRRDREALNADPISLHEQRFESLEELFGHKLKQDEWGFEFPASYNVTRIELMIRDPAWLFSYWDIDNAQRTELEKDKEFTGLLLRLENFDYPELKQGQVSMEIPVQLSDRSWYLNTGERECFYALHLIAQFVSHEKTLSSSQKVYVPKGSLTKQIDVVESFELDAVLVLSGIESLGATADIEIPRRILRVAEGMED